MEIYPGDKVTRTIKILWPDGPRWVPVATIMMWASDAYYNHADYYICNRCGQNTMEDKDWCEHDADCTPVWNNGTTEPRTLQESMDLLSDLGLVTFAKHS